MTTVEKCMLIVLLFELELLEKVMKSLDLGCL